MEIEYRRAALAEIHELRTTVLRPGQAALYFPGDDGGPPGTWHFGGFLQTGRRNVACLTLLANEFEGAAALQLRGMAVAQGYRGQGAGRRLLELAEAVAGAEGGGRVWWCNAREEAMGFYGKNGWRVVGERFVIEGVGPHFKMMKEW